MLKITDKVRNLYDRIKMKDVNGFTSSNYNFKIYRPAQEFKGVPDYELTVVKCMLTFSLSVVLLKILFKYGGYLEFFTTFFKSMWYPNARFTFEMNCFLIPSIVGVTATFATYLAVYYTSDVPSVSPPSPFSSKKSSWHSCYIWPIVNGVIFFIATLLLN